MIYLAVLGGHFLLYLIAMVMVRDLFVFKDLFILISSILYCLFFLIMISRDKRGFIFRYRDLRNEFPLRNTFSSVVMSCFLLYACYRFYEEQKWILDGGLGEFIYLFISVTGVAFLMGGVLAWWVCVFIFYKEINGE